MWRPRGGAKRAAGTGPAAAGGSGAGEGGEGEGEGEAQGAGMMSVGRNGTVQAVRGLGCWGPLVGGVCVAVVCLDC